MPTAMEYALYDAVGDNDLLEVEQLLSQGVNINAIDDQSYTPLHWVAIRNRNDYYFRLAEVLLKNGADPNARDNDGQTPFYHLVEYSNVRILKLFLDYKADINVTDNRGKNLLFQAAGFNDEVMQFLINLGLSVHHRCNSKKTPLHWACCSIPQNARIIKCLLKSGADIHALDETESTPLILASQKYNGVLNKSESRKKLYKFTLEHSDVNKLNSNQEHILTFFRDYNTFELRYLVFRHLAKLQSLDILVHPALLKAIPQDKDFGKSFEKYKEELLKAKNTKLQDCWITFYNLLFDSRKKIKNYAGNRDLIETFNKSNCKKKFPYYGSSMIKNVKNGIRRRVLFDKSVDLLSDCLPCFNPTHLVISDILDCIMSKKDLSKFCESDKRCQ